MEAMGVGRRNQRGEDGGGSLSGREHREVGSVWGEAQGLLAWVLVEALFSTQMINTRVSAVYLMVSYTYVYSIFLKLHVSVQFSSIQSLSHVRLCNPMDCSKPGSLSITNSWSLLKLMSIESVMPSNHLILCRPPLLPSIFPSIRVFSNESALRMYMRE